MISNLRYALLLLKLIYMLSRCTCLLFQAMHFAEELEVFLAWDKLLDELYDFG